MDGEDLMVKARRRNRFNQKRRKDHGFDDHWLDKSYRTVRDNEDQEYDPSLEGIDEDIDAY